MIIVSRGTAMAVRGRYPAARQQRFSPGKYRWQGSVRHYVGQEVDDIAGVLAVWPERRHDADGPYACLMCLSEPQITRKPEGG